MHKKSGILIKYQVVVLNWEKMDSYVSRRDLQYSGSPGGALSPTSKGRKILTFGVNARK